MLKILRKDRWSPYIVGALIGVLLIFLMTQEQILGASTAIARVGAVMENAIIPSQIENASFFHRILGDGAVFDWFIVYIIGVFLGSLLASKISIKQPFKRNTIWEKNFGSSKSKRAIGAFMGGVLLMIGARLADGCTSGHAISGAAMLSLPSWVFMFSVFAMAIPTSFILYRKN